MHGCSAVGSDGIYISKELEVWLQNICTPTYTMLRAGWPRNYGSTHNRGKVRFFCEVCILAVGPIQLHIHWVMGAYSLG
jgi:hypothetical protein